MYAVFSCFTKLASKRDGQVAKNGFYIKFTSEDLGSYSLYFCDEMICITQ